MNIYPQYKQNNTSGQAIKNKKPPFNFEQSGLSEFWTKALPSTAEAHHLPSASQGGTTSVLPSPLFQMRKQKETRSD